MPEGNISGDYVLANSYVTPWPHEKPTVDVEKPTENIGLLPMREENDYVQNDTEWPIQKNQ